ncbi:Flp family type IVb pilin [Lichenifustis flavocetrariae]|uniref:Flp family type IVb pilin n=1 Tax=Lichenifustis flavocetrariae TaxID=2949735 RepID=A0AA41YWP7_9HYPH|nr:Flp family type IVb pilin [Lichenifustis flavocetrariae]MCW6509504.1 Flp family type IVb pilin [Lichenifustis flavocetrariae]
MKRFLADRTGATSLEYAMIAAVISIVIVAASTEIGIKLNAKFFGPVVGGLN